LAKLDCQACQANMKHTVRKKKTKCISCFDKEKDHVVSERVHEAIKCDQCQKPFKDKDMIIETSKLFIVQNVVQEVEIDE
jgi:protein-arginine kinase activator protein McsA